MCHFLISCCSVLKPLLPLCREWTRCSFLFVMLITLSLTVPHFSCQLAFILFCFLPPPPSSAVYRQPSRGRFKSLPASLAAPGTNYIMQQPGPFQFWRAETDRNWIYYLSQQRHTFICSLFPSPNCPSVVSSTKVSPDSTNEGLVVYNKPTGRRVTHHLV